MRTLNLITAICFFVVAYVFIFREDMVTEADIMFIGIFLAAEGLYCFFKWIGMLINETLNDE